SYSRENASGLGMVLSSPFLNQRLMDRSAAFSVKRASTDECNCIHFVKRIQNLSLTPAGE
ncbi:MAG: hypothetical protein ACM3PS_16825, partial [Syntrophothermus sp.]